MPTLEVNEIDLKLFEEAMTVRKEENIVENSFDTKEILNNIKAKENNLLAIKKNYDSQWDSYVSKCKYLLDKFERLLILFLKTDGFKNMVLETFKDEVTDCVTQNDDNLVVGTSEVLRGVELKLKELSYYPTGFNIYYDQKFQKRVADIVKVFLIEEEDGYLKGYKVKTRAEGYGMWEHIDVILTEIDN